MIPALAVLIVLGAIIRFELWHLALVIGILGGFGGTAIVLKSQALAVKVKPFIDAAGWRAAATLTSSSAISSRT
jgi:peptide/nickel transport system permease protein